MRTGASGMRLAVLPVLLACWLAPALSAAPESAQVLHEWPVTGPRLPAGVSFYEIARADVQAEARGEPDTVFPDGRGAITVVVARSPATQRSDIQLNCLPGGPLGRGGKYRVSFWVRSSQPAPISAAAITDEAPWAALGPDARLEVQCGPDWQLCGFTFTADRDIATAERVRAPYLGLGCVPAGVTVWVAGMALAEVEPPPPPVPLLRSAELLANPGFEAGSEGWLAQASVIAPASGEGVDGTTACRVTGRTERWGTPSQDIRAAMLAHGPGFYEFGARVRAVQGKGSTLAVIHFRDATGDHWVTSETRGLSDAGYARLSVHRLIVWTGDLQAADIGIQTTGDDRRDLLVDDFTLRALDDLTRGRPVAASGEAPGHPAAAACDGDVATTWQAPAAAEAWLEVDLGARVAFNTCVLGEAGRHVRSYVLEVAEGDQWRGVFTGGRVLGGIDTLCFPPVSGRKIRLRLTATDGPAALTAFSLYTTALRERTTRVPVPPAGLRERGSRTLVGAIRWDGWCGDRSKVGLELERVMGAEKYHDRLPFYARVLGPGQVEARCVSQETMDREIALAAAAGVDYWAFDWYPPGDGLATARLLYLSSPHRGEVKWCAILCTGAFSDTDRRWLVQQFAAPEYQKVQGGRPLVYFFNAGQQFAPLVKSLRDAAAAVGCPAPFIVFMGWGASIAEPAAACGADAVGAYVNPIGGGLTFAAGMARERQQWEALRQTGQQVVPTVTTGWDPRPFLDCPVAWYPGATERNWGERARPDQVAEQLRASLDFVQKDPDATLANTVLIYAWNENAEGGWIVPTLGEMAAGRVPLRLDAVRGVLKPGVPRGSGWDKLLP